MRRLNRAVNKEDAVYPPLVSKSPLIELNKGGSDRRERIVRGVPGTSFKSSDTTDIVRGLRLEAEKHVPKAPPIDCTKQFDLALMQRILGFLGDTPQSLMGVCRANRSWRQASLSIVDEVIVFPHLVGFHTETQSQGRNITSLETFFGKDGRGQHIRRLTMVDGRGIYILAQSYKGPRLAVPALNQLISQMPNLSHLDVRGIDIQDFVPLSDRFLSSLHMITPCLRTVKIGCQFTRNWAPQWWVRLPYLSGFVVGSRREDADWDDGSLLTLPEDFFAMLRSPAHTWGVVKIWTPLSHSSFSSLALPTASFPKVVALALNASGNCQIKPLEEGVPDAPKDEKKKTEKVVKKGAQSEDAATVKGTYPSLISFTLADVTERPDFGAEMMAKMTQQAPHLKHFNVTNTLRSAPTHIEPPSTKGRKTRRVV